jgi:hypothetical protein
MQQKQRLRVECLECRWLLAASVVINEVHFDPDVKTEPVEFVELYNSGDIPADLSGWSFNDGISYTFPEGVTVPSDGYVVVAQDPGALARQYSVPSLGPFSGRLSNEGERLALVNARGDLQDEVTYRLGFPWPTVGDAPGNSIELIHHDLDNDLGGAWRSSLSAPTPLARNSRFSVNAPPLPRQVRHDPQQPTSGSDVTISVKVTDDQSVSRVRLSYQLVDPGDYIAIDDPRYFDNWTTVPMRDDGQLADDQAADGVFTATLPSNLQQHRRLVRYRITAADALGASITVPYDDDPVPNFAYYVYDGIPDWHAAVRPSDEPVTFPGQLLQRVQTYQLLTTRSDHVNSQQLPGATEPPYTGREYLWHGTLVVGGQVYDHIRYRPRGGENRFARGKNAWKFDFNRGHPLAAVDNYGNAYTTTWTKLNLDHIANANFRGEHSMAESLSYRLFNLANVESPNTHFVHFRIVENADQSPAHQYATDFQGLYLAVEQMDGRFLDEHGLPDGNLYKIELGLNVAGSLNNQGPTQPTDSSDLIQFVDGYVGRNGRPDAQWWRDHLDVERYYSYRSIVEAVRHYDITGTNQFYFHNPATNRWSVHPWDLDLTWRSSSFGSGGDAIAPRMFRQEELVPDYHNRLREIVDLLFNHDQTDMLIDETARFIFTPGQLSFVDADRAMWDFNPIIEAAGFGGVGQYYAASSTGDFAGMVQAFKNFVDIRTDYINRRILKSDEAIPTTPSMTYIGDVDYALNRLEFRSSEYHSPTAAPFAAMQWRIAEVTNTLDPSFDPNERRKYEINATWDSGAITTFNETITIPSGNLAPGRTYRVRVRLRDAAGFWSHWSQPAQFVAAPGKGLLVEGLRVTEINYHPADPPLDSRFQDEDFEFIELQNVGNQALDLAGVSLKDGVRLSLPADVSLPLLPGERIVVVANSAAFASRYGTAIRIAGQYEGKLNNGGDRIVLVTATDELIQDFRYDDENGWPTAADGDGATLEAIDPLADDNDPRNWRASRFPGGTPGAASKVPGDANGDGAFNSADLIAVLQAGEYEDDIEGNSSFEEGDWDGDGDFTSHDLVFAFQSEAFEHLNLIRIAAAMLDDSRLNGPRPSGRNQE